MPTELQTGTRVSFGKADFLLITALDEERRALIRHFSSPVRRLKQSSSDVRVYYYANLPLPGKRHYKVVVMPLSAMGRVRAAVATATAIRRWHPSVVLLVGIAGGIQGQNVRLGDVVVADQVIDYELQKIKRPTQVPRFQVYRTDPRLLQTAHNLSSAWQPARRSRPQAGLSKVHFGPVATGDKVVARQNFFGNLLKNWPQLLGIEMEAGGVATACFESAGSTSFFMVRGVSDLADDHKDSAGVKQWRQFACDVAARYAVALMQSEPLPSAPRRTPPIPSKKCPASPMPGDNNHRPGFPLDQYLTELERFIIDSRVGDWYVPILGYLDTEKESGKQVSLDDYVDSWLGHRSKGGLAILGDYGTGKSWFCLNLVKHLVDKYRRSPRKAPLPLLINFKHFEPQMDLEKLIQTHLFDEYGVKVTNPAELRMSLRTGIIFPILDGLDEMAKVIGERAAIVAYSRLGLASEIPRVLITCRTHYFYTGSEQRELLSTDQPHFTLTQSPHFDILHICMLDKSQLRKCVARRFDVQKAGNLFRFIESKYNLMELCSRLVLLSLICESYDLLPNLASASSSTDLYEAYIESWLQRELQDGRLILEPDVIKGFFEDLAEDMLKRDTLAISSSELSRQLSKLLYMAGLRPDRKKEIERQLITSTFISRKGNDGWQFGHRSFQEFFYARKFFRWEVETKGNGAFPVLHIPIWQFISEMSLHRWDEQKALFWIVPRIKREADASLTLTTLRATAAYWLLKKRRISARDLPLSDIMLDSVDLTDLNLEHCDLSYADLHGSNLEGTNLSSARLDGSHLAGAQFRGVNFHKANLSRSDISYANFQNANFGPYGSTLWVSTVKQLKECRGYSLATFDDEVCSLLLSKQKL